MRRRRFLQSLTGLAAAGHGLAQPAAEDVTFFVVADPQVHLDKWGVAGTEAMLRTMNALPGKPFPAGGMVPEPRAVLVAGDLVDVVDDHRHWESYRRMFDPNGEALMRFRAFEGIGNHDLSPESATGFSWVQREVMRRHRLRRGPERFHYDTNGYHHSWDWGRLHVVNLNLFPGTVARPVYGRPAAWNNPAGSLEFLREDLRERVGRSGRPVALMWHYGLRGWGLEKWWTPEDLAALKAVVAGYNVVLILHGHEHAYARYTWEGIPVFMCPSPQRDRDPKTAGEESTPKGFLVVHLAHGRLHVLHHEAASWGEAWSTEVQG